VCRHVPDHSPPYNIIYMILANNMFYLITFYNPLRKRTTDTNIIRILFSISLACYK
jgi:hypothetical protein